DLISAPFVSLIGFFQALAILKKFSPDALVSTGGYASLPVVLAARVLGIPIFIQEQNVLPGFTNRLYGRLAKNVFLSFEGSKKYLDGIVTGNPVRRRILDADRENSRRELGYASGSRVILIMGGSQGARSINETIKQTVENRAWNAERGEMRILHIVGRRDWPRFSDIRRDGYQAVEYLHDMSAVLAAADLVVSRAGATAIAEFAARGLPMILVPFPYSAEGHQDLNASLVEAAGAGITVMNDEFTPEKFIALVSGAKLDLAEMGRASKKLGCPQAAEKIVDLILRAEKR
ncbi:MAG: UDP-N-acetylglucosamine--N-acetylmuramyl-(pentapeptide) pyrophosphoryl-undecaprenol N-acetylglucosamine transferase, partial [Candidatus Margulisbacteria bacterium]|nr:UDP-N-acetylglucosamine--N-acetylmuramyl-(pentapeptide) pyrophosphoryl-undecaprenol N-acetylglucosamine transferase [Candidatus Margulisiibacteriota bacterium]